MGIKLAINSWLFKSFFPLAGMAFLIAVSSCVPGGTGTANGRIVEPEPANDPFPFLPPFKQTLLLAPDVNFGDVDIGQKSQQKLTLKNPVDYEVTDLKFVPIANSKFIISNASACQKIANKGQCSVDIEFSPQNIAQIKEGLKIEYKLGGREQSQIFYVSAHVKDKNMLTISGDNFGAKTVSINKKFKTSIQIYKISGAMEASDFVLAPNPNYTVKSGSCLTDKIAIGQNCTLVLQTKAKIVADGPVSENLTLEYKLGSVNKRFDFSLNGSYKFVKPVVADHDFGVIKLPLGATHKFTIKFKNPVISSADKITDMKIVGMPASLSLKASKNGCSSAVTHLNPGEACNFKVVITGIKDELIDQKLRVRFEINGLPNEFLFHFRADIKVPIKTNYVTVSNGNFGIIHLLAGQTTFPVKLTVKNTKIPAVHLTNFSIERRDPINTSVVLPWAATYVMQNDASSTCKSTTDLDKDDTCDFVLQFTPTAGGAIDDILAIKFRNPKGQNKEVIVPLKGSWITVSMGGGGPAKLTLLNDMIVGLANNYYNKPYPKDPTDYVAKTINGNTIRVYRPNHGLAHSMRKAALAIYTAELLKTVEVDGSYPNTMGQWIVFHTDPTGISYNPNFIEQLAFGMLMFRSGRSYEGNFYYKEDCEKSAQNFKDEAKATGLFPEQEDIDDTVFAMETVGDQEKCFDNHTWIQTKGCTWERLLRYQFMYAVHHLDLRRMNGFDKDRIVVSIAEYLMLLSNNLKIEWANAVKNNDKAQKLKIMNIVLASTPVSKLWDRSGELLKLTGDSDMDDNSLYRYADVFYILSNGPPKMRQVIEDWLKSKPI